LCEPRGIWRTRFKGIYAKRVGFHISILVVLQVIDATPGIEEIPDPQLVDAQLRGAREGAESMGLLRGPVTAGASAANNALGDLATADDFQTTYIQPLRIFGTVTGNLANVWTIFLCWKRAD
jgi:hypothetical protein